MRTSCGCTCSSIFVALALSLLADLEITNWGYICAVADGSHEDHIEECEEASESTGASIATTDSVARIQWQQPTKNFAGMLPPH